MLVALVSFTDPFDGLPVVAGQTRVAPFADVAVKFPERFGPDPEERVRSRTTVRGPGRVVRASRTGTPLPTLYEDLEPTYTAELGYAAEKTIRTDIRWTDETFGDVETGGWLLAAERNPNYILAATVPGTDASFSRSTISLGFEQLEAAQRQHGDMLVIGCWHRHLDDDLPSDGDLRGFARGAKLGGGRWLSLIAAPSRSWRAEPELSGWITFGPRLGLQITERLRLR